MTIEKTDTLIVGAGQAGVAMSEHLTKLGVPHIVLERDRIAEKWRTGRWDSLVMNGPAWHDCFPNMTFDEVGFDKVGPDDFPTKDQVANYFENYAKKFNAPIRTGVEVQLVERNNDRPGFTVTTSKGVIEARRVVAATGPFQHGVIPPIAPDLNSDTDKIIQMHSAQYNNPEQLPEGAVMVIGAGSSGVQIANEIQRSGKKVYLSIGSHNRPPRSYRNRDFVWWLGVLGLWDLEATQPGTVHVTIAVSGAYGGHSIDFRQLANEGMTLLGLTKDFTKDGAKHIVRFEADLAENITYGDNNYKELLDAADAYIERNKLDLPEEPEARNIHPDPECLTNPVLELDLKEVGITSIIWATGYKVDFSWLNVNAFDDKNQPRHQRGVSTEAGVYFLGLPWLSRRGSSFIWGVWHDAKHIADHIAIQRSYLDYHDDASRRQT